MSVYTLSSRKEDETWFSTYTVKYNIKQINTLISCVCTQFSSTNIQQTHLAKIIHNYNKIVYLN